MSLTMVIAGIVVIDLLVVIAVLGLARSAARADDRAKREFEALQASTPKSRRFVPAEPARAETPYPGERERPGPSGARAAGARPRPQR